MAISEPWLGGMDYSRVVSSCRPNWDDETLKREDALEPIVDFQYGGLNSKGFATHRALEDAQIRFLEQTLTSGAFANSHT